MILFVDKDTQEARSSMSGQDLSAYSKDKCVFLIITKPEVVSDLPAKTGKDRNKSIEKAVSVVPQSKLTASSIWDAYKGSNNTVVVADKYGNESIRFNSVPKEKLLVKSIDAIKDFSNQLSKDLDNEYVKIAATTEKGRTSLLVKQILKVFKKDVVGYEAVDKTIDTYNKLIEDNRLKIESASVDQLKIMAKEFKGTDLEKEIEQAILTKQ